MTGDRSKLGINTESRIVSNFDSNDDICDSNDVKCDNDGNFDIRDRG